MDGEKTRGADARKVRRLLKPARLDRRLSLTPPISINVLSTQERLPPIRLHAHSPSRSGGTLHGQSHDQIPIDFCSRRSMPKSFKRGRDEGEDKTT